MNLSNLNGAMSRKSAPRDFFESQSQNFIVEDVASTTPKQGKLISDKEKSLNQRFSISSAAPNDYSKTGEAPYAVSFHNSGYKDFTD